MKSMNARTLSGRCRVAEFGAALLSALLAATGAHGFNNCFLAAAWLTLAPMAAVLRLDSTKVLALLTSNPLQEKTV